MAINEEEINNAKSIIASYLEKYVEIIKKEYQGLISKDILNYLQNIEYENIIVIKQTQTISMFVRNGIIYFPINAYKIMNLMSKLPGFGSSKNHRTYNDDNLIINNNTFFDYIKHVFVSGLTPLEFYLETLLHESLHLCGSNGANALSEGINELKTRELALKYNLKTSACGYPKEVMIALTLQNIFGVELINKIAFAKNNQEIYMIISDTINENAAQLFFDISREMEKEFLKYYNKFYSGIMGPIKKANEYDKINYQQVYELIYVYIKNNNLTQPNIVIS